mmetsp:Transcript_58559/g.107788  ORF Transcript_58559/g.107788 Transcript_58559/m.107788 type:complete len:432 (-) Transcript_58559:94-1389(-)
MHHVCAAWVNVFLLAAAATRAAALITIPLEHQEVPMVINNVTVAQKTAYFGKIFVGEPAHQAFTVVFDTGSGHLILPSVKCDEEACLGKQRYDAAASSSALAVNRSGGLAEITDQNRKRERLTVTFGIGSVTGELVSESVCLLDPAEHGRPAAGCTSRLPMVMATSMSKDPFKSFKFDGVLGLGLSPLSLKQDFNFFGVMAGQHAGSFEHKFGLFLSADPRTPSEISFGGYDREHCGSPVNWTPVNRPELGYWQISIKSIRIGDQALPMCDAGDCKAIMDTGTSLLGVPRSELRTVHKSLARALPKDHGEVDCREVAGPPIVFDLGSFSVELTAADYSRMGPASMLVAGGGPKEKRDFCRASLLPVDLGKSPLGSKVFVFGEPVLRRYYTVFDAGKKQVGFARARRRSGNGGHAAKLPQDLGSTPAGSTVV